MDKHLYCDRKRFSSVCKHNSMVSDDLHLHVLLVSPFFTFWLEFWGEVGLSCSFSFRFCSFLVLLFIKRQLKAEILMQKHNKAPLGV